MQGDHGDKAWAVRGELTAEGTPGSQRKSVVWGWYETVRAEKNTGRKVGIT